MAERTERAVINHLIEICRDAERGFRAAAADVRSPELRTLFTRLAEQRREFVDELLPHAYRLGGPPAADGTNIAALHRAWMHYRARFSSDPETAVIEEAARGERIAQKSYDDAINEVLAPQTRQVVEAQDLGIRAARQLVTGMKES